MPPPREDIGSWLSGAPGGASVGRASRLGLPAQGSGSPAPLGRRVAALVVDWALSTAVSTAFLDAHPMATLAVFGVSTALLVSTTGNTIGHRLLALRVVALRDVVRPGEGARTGRTRRGVVPEPVVVPPPGVIAGLTRTVLLCLAVPAVVWDSTGRGMHDVAAGTAIVRR